MIIADTGAILALIDADDRHHLAFRSLLVNGGARWLLPWAILPEVDYLLGTHVGRRAQQGFFGDVAAGAFEVDWGEPGDLRRARELDGRYEKLRLGLVDGIVIAMAERLKVLGIATTDLKHFGAVAIRGKPALLPRDR